MNNMILCDEISDNTEVERLKNITARMLEKPHLISHEWIRENNWAIIPVQYSINAMDAEWISEAAIGLGYEYGFAITTEENIQPRAFKIMWNQEYLLEIDRELGLINFLIAPYDLSFAILRECGDYFLVAGPKEFVRKAVGASFKTTRMMFKDYYVSDETLPSKLRGLLLDVYNQYLPYDGGN